MLRPYHLLFLFSLIPAWAQGLAPHGFADARFGTRTGDDPLQRDIALAELRLELEFNHLGERSELMVRADLRYDDLDADHWQLDLERGSGPLDLREAWLQFSPTDLVDVKLGRQILTWGTGDLVFINDLFPKDWQSFFSGRDTEYLKAPSDALMASFFPSFGSVDVVYLPAFDGDRYLTGERFSIYNPDGGATGRANPVIVDPLNRWFEDDEVTLRVSGNKGGMEWALYGYDGYWKSPQGFNPETGNAIFPGLRVLGASLRGTLGKGLFHAELGHYNSKEDGAGSNPLLPNGEWRYLVGYERELGTNFTGAFQYYVEHMRHYGAYAQSLPDGAVKKDRNRQVITQRYTLRRMKTNLMMSLFVYYSPSDKDGYARPAVNYKMNDDWQLGMGGNIFWGEQPTTFFGQFEDGSNLYTSLRYSF